jgi:gamma-glutamyltranspeptidase/glutathione hydrolase
VYAQGLPSLGGVHTIEGVNLAEAFDLAGLGRSTGSSKAFFWLTQIGNLCYTDYFEAPSIALWFPGLDMTPKSRATKDTARALAARMRAGEIAFTQAPRADEPHHSDAIVAVDSSGNVAAVVHSANTDSWGATGLFVDGISIPDSASFQQAAIRRAGAGHRLPDPTEPLIVLRDEQPIFALASIGSGLHEKTLSVLLGLLDQDLDIKAAIDAPSLHLPHFDAAGKPHPQVSEGEFDAALLDAVRKLGLDVKVLVRASPRRPAGWSASASIPGTRRERPPPRARSTARRSGSSTREKCVSPRPASGLSRSWAPDPR